MHVKSITCWLALTLHSSSIALTLFYMKSSWQIHSSDSAIMRLEDMRPPNSSFTHLLCSWLIYHKSQRLTRKDPLKQINSATFLGQHPRSHYYLSTPLLFFFSLIVFFHIIHKSLLTFSSMSSLNFPSLCQRKLQPFQIKCLKTMQWR